MTYLAPVAPPVSVQSRDPGPAPAILAVAEALQPDLAQGFQIDALRLRLEMERAFGCSDADGAWDWKLAYEAGEVALVLFLRKFGRALLARAGSLDSLLPILSKVADLLPTHTRRSEEMERFQQFSTPLPMGLAALAAAQITPRDLVLEPSAGTGLLAILSEIAGGSLALNELAETRADLLRHLFPGCPVTTFDAAQIDDHLDPGVRPSVILMNPPFSVVANVDGRTTEATARHLRSALARLAPGGRLVAITGASFAPDAPVWAETFTRLTETAYLVFTGAMSGAAFAKHGTSFETRISVFDKCRGGEAGGITADLARPISPDVASLHSLITAHVPPRLALAQVASAGQGRTFPFTGNPSRTTRTAISISRATPATPPTNTAAQIEATDLTYTLRETADDLGAVRLSDAIYETFRLQAIDILGAAPHPTKLVQSAAMASVTPPKPSYRPKLPAAVLRDGLLSDAQLETVIYAGEAHGAYLAGSWTVDETGDMVSAAPDDAADAVRFRRGFFLGDGTGAGKGRQSAGILLDNWCQGRRKALWISKSDKLLEDAQRDWSALGQERLLVTPLSRFAQGRDIPLTEGILFTTYATLRSEERGAKKSRVDQIVDWLGADFDGVILFDESHAMANAAGSKGERGDTEASQQGRAGLRLQHKLPNARVVYVSATGATTVHNLAYAQRLGLWGGEDSPFATRAEFVEAIEAGGVAAMEVLARDLRSLGLYTARSLSYDGVEYEMLEHALTLEQRGIYDAYAGAFAIIHNNLAAAMEAANITGDSGTLNRQAKSAARSAFESAKQRFFGHLLTSMKTPTLIAAIDADLSAGHAAVIQIVSTGEALMERRLSEIPTEEWNDIRVDITPREYVLDYLAHSFPVQLYEPFTDSEGNLSSRPVVRDGQPVECREAARRRDALIEKLASLPPVPGALDQIVQRFGTDLVAEVTGRSRRIVRKGEGHTARLVVESRAGSANLSETAGFMDDQKRILIFSDAGGTGRSYHADLGAKNQRLRVHYLLEPGWKADAAIQGLGRTNRTNQAQPPLFRPVATDVKAEKRFLSTIARRLDTLGAITRGQRQTGGQGLFRPEDNLESPYARDALRQLYRRIYRGDVAGCSLGVFEDATGLSLTDDNGLKDDLAENAEGVCRAYLPAGRREGSYWIVGDLQNNPGRSLFVRLTGPASGPGAAGKFTDGATGEHGDLLDIIRNRTGISRFPDLLAEARAHLGRPQPVFPDAPMPKKAKASGGTPAAAARLFAASVPVAGTLADTYLRSRGLTQGGRMSALRFHPKCWHRDEGQTRIISRPALIAAVTDGEGVLLGVHRTWLAPDGQRKARVETQRRAMGHLLGNAVKLTPHDDILVVGEGIETTLSLVEAGPGLPVWAALSSGHLGAVLLPEGLQRLYIAIDRDPAGRHAAERLSARATEVGIAVRVLEPRLGDFNDDLRANGKEALRQHLAGQIGPEDRHRLFG